MYCFNVVKYDSHYECMKLETLLERTPLVQYKLAYSKNPVVVLKHGLLDFV